MSDAVDFFGFGKYLPKTIETNEEVARRLQISEQEILQKSGIEYRYIAKEETATFMAAEALREAVDSAGISPRELNAILVATFSGDYRYPNTASRLCADLGLVECLAVDLHANCAGFQIGLSSARDMLLANPSYKYVAVVGVARQSPFLDLNDINTAYFFSDAASAVIVGRRPGVGGLLRSIFKTNGKSYELVRLRAGGSSFPYHENLWANDRHAFYYEHAGLAVWKEVIVEMPQLMKKCLDGCEWRREDLDLVLMHQANLRLIEYIMSRMRLPMSKTVVNVNTIGNTADASLGTVLYDAHKSGALSASQKSIFASVGAGFIYAATPYSVVSAA